MPALLHMAAAVRAGALDSYSHVRLLMLCVWSLSYGVTRLDPGLLLQGELQKTAMTLERKEGSYDLVRLRSNPKLTLPLQLADPLYCQHEDIGYAELSKYRHKYPL